MRLFVTRVPAPNALRDNGTKWQIVIEYDDGRREEEDPDQVTLLGVWTFGADETGTPSVWLEPVRVGGGYDDGKLLLG